MSLGCGEAIAEGVVEAIVGAEFGDAAGLAQELAEGGGEVGFVGDRGYAHKPVHGFVAEVAVLIEGVDQGQDGLKLGVVFDDRLQDVATDAAIEVVERITFG